MKKVQNIDTKADKRKPSSEIIHDNEENHSSDKEEDVIVGQDIMERVDEAIDCSCQKGEKIGKKFRVTNLFGCEVSQYLSQVFDLDVKGCRIVIDKECGRVHQFGYLTLN